VAAESAGLVLYRARDGKTEVLLVHPGGPFWKRRDEGVWSIPKGEIEPGETRLDVARREFQEELGMPPPDGDLAPLGSIRQAGGKVVHAWASPGDLDASRISSGTFTLEWPPRSGRMQEFPEVDRAAWFDLATARRMILPAQSALLDRLEEQLSV
jgi:predicted NUDIX family NTP pyrophosphohydrolase